MSRPLKRRALASSLAISAVGCKQRGVESIELRHPSALALPDHLLETFCSVFRERSIGTYPRSLELRGGVVVPLECSVDDLGAHVYHVRHDGLALRAVPRHVSGLSESVSVGGSVVLMEHRGLSGSPLSVSVGNGRIPG